MTATGAGGSADSEAGANAVGGGVGSLAEPLRPAAGCAFACVHCCIRAFVARQHAHFTWQRVAM